MSEEVKTNNQITDLNSEAVIPVSMKTFQKIEAVKDVLTKLASLSWDTTMIIDYDSIIQAGCQALLESYNVEKEEK